MIELKFEFLIEGIVFIKNDSEQLERVVTEISIKPKGLILYQLSCGTTTSWHYGFELSTEKDILETLK